MNGVHERVPPARLPPSPQRLRHGRLRRLDPAAARLANRFYASGPVAAGTHWQLHWQAAAQPVEQGLVCGTQDLDMWWGLNPWSALEPLLALDWQALPEAARQQAVDDAAEPVFAALEALCGHPLRTRSFGALPPSLQEAGCLRLGFVLRGREPGSPAAVGEWVAPARVLQAAADRLPHRPPAAWPGLPLSVGLELARLRLPLRDVLDLSPGDALRLGTRSRREALSRLTLTLGTRHWAAVSRDERLLIVEGCVPHPEEEIEPGAADEALHPLHEAPCTVHIEVGRLQMTVAELAALAPGSTVGCGVRLEDQPVWLVVNGRRLARGELVEVGDELAVVVSEVPAGNGRPGSP